jgi:hypothetical protein
MKLTGLLSFCGSLNLSGLLSIEYVPTTFVDEVAYRNNSIYPLNHISNIPLLPGEAWLKAPALQVGKIWNENQQLNEQGVYYEQTVNLIVPGLSPAASVEIDEMAYYRYLLRLKDRHNVHWVMGTLETPFRLISSGTSGDGGNRKQHQFIFQCETLKKAIGFVIN